MCLTCVPKETIDTSETRAAAAPEVRAVKSKVGRFHGEASSVIKGGRTVLAALNYHLLKSQIRAWL